MRITEEQFKQIKNQIMKSKADPHIKAKLDCTLNVVFYNQQIYPDLKKRFTKLLRKINKLKY